VANKDHLDLLHTDVDAWNTWRQANPKIKPDLSSAHLSRADLTLANLSGACLREANLVMANLRGADLRHADLTQASLVGARLLGVDLLQANLSGADLRTAEDLTQEQINHTRGDSRTRLPPGIKHPATWH